MGRGLFRFCLFLCGTERVSVTNVFALAQIAFILLLSCHYGHICSVPVRMKLKSIRNRSGEGTFSAGKRPEPEVLFFFASLTENEVWKKAFEFY